MSKQFLIDAVHKAKNIGKRTAGWKNKEIPAVSNDNEYDGKGSAREYVRKQIKENVSKANLPKSGKARREAVGRGTGGVAVDHGY